MSSSDSDNILEFSDDAQEVTWDSAKRFKLLFGKHKGRRLGTMIRKPKHRDYLKYLLGWDDIRPDTAKHISCALDYYREMKNRRQ
jgi:hypothetical protein